MLMVGAQKEGKIKGNIVPNAFVYCTYINVKCIKPDHTVEGFCAPENV